MSQKQHKKIRQLVRRRDRRGFQEWLEEASTLGLVVRLRLAWAIVMGIGQDPRRVRSWLAEHFDAFFPPVR